MSSESKAGQAKRKRRATKADEVSLDVAVPPTAKQKSLQSHGLNSKVYVGPHSRQQPRGPGPPCSQAEGRPHARSTRRQDKSGDDLAVEGLSVRRPLKRG
jgi:hypothetical protein